MTKREDRLRAALTAAFSPERLEIIDDSASHAGHSGATPGGETHYSIHVVSEHFAGQSRVARSRAVHAVLSGELQSGLHAVALDLKSPAEQQKR